PCYRQILERLAIGGSLGNDFPGDGIYGLFGFGRHRLLFAFTRIARPNVEPSTPVGADVPRAPDAFAFAKSPIEDVVRPNVTLRPIALPIVRIVSASDHKPANVIDALSGENAIRERKLHVNSMPSVQATAVIIKANPRA